MIVVLLLKAESVVAMVFIIDTAAVQQYSYSNAVERTWIRRQWIRNHRKPLLFLRSFISEC
jgi:hypothetical protein